MGPRDLGDGRRREVLARARRERGALRVGVPVGERGVERQHRRPRPPQRVQAVPAEAALVRGDDEAERRPREVAIRRRRAVGRGGVVRHVVPGGARGRGGDAEVGHDPGRVRERRPRGLGRVEQRRRRVPRERADRVRRGHLAEDGRAAAGRVRDGDAAGARDAAERGRARVRTSTPAFARRAASASATWPSPSGHV